MSLVPQVVPHRDDRQKHASDSRTLKDGTASRRRTPANVPVGFESGSAARIQAAGGSGRLDHGPVTLLGRLSRGTEDAPDLLPGQSCGASGDNGVDDLLLATGPSQNCSLQQVPLDGTFVAWFWLVGLEALGQVGGVVEGCPVSIGAWWVTSGTGHGQPSRA